jgi:MSHA biogenesis protein MshJ
MQLQLEGSYLATLRYLRALEDLPWKFFWEGVEYEVIEHPTARITLDLYTLGIKVDG